MDQKLVLASVRKVWKLIALPRHVTWVGFALLVTSHRNGPIVTSG